MVGNVIAEECVGTEWGWGDMGWAGVESEGPAHLGFPHREALGNLDGRESRTTPHPLTRKEALGSGSG